MYIELDQEYTDIKAGDRVQMIASTRILAVTYVKEDHVQAETGGGRVKLITINVAWLDEIGVPHRETYSPNILRKVN